MILTMPSRTPKPGLPKTPCGLYVHVPFCASKCGYCDFYSVEAKTRDLSRLVECLLCELRQRAASNLRKISTIFLGGGTPTILTMDQLAGLADGLSSVVDGRELDEFTVEANPATVDGDKAALLVDRGVTRVSMGAQSFVPSELAILERLHTPDDIAPSFEILRGAGVGQINLDLIFGIPGQTMATWSESLRRAIDLAPDHIACYGLTYEPGTSLTAARRANRITPCGEQLEADLYLRAIETLTAAGFEHYEISNFARPGCRCQHNLNYWRNGPYVGVGPSAAGCLDGRRYKNVADVDRYAELMDSQGHAEADTEIIDTPRLMTEMIMMQLRLIEGLSVSAFREATGSDPVALFGSTLQRLVELGKVIVSDTHIALTRAGLLVSDAVMAELAYACDQHLDSCVDPRG